MQIRSFLSAVVISLVTAGACFGQAKERRLIWSDEFNYPGLPDTTRWAYDVGGHGWGNNELQYYTFQKPENARVQNGFLVIEARNEPFNGREFTSARLTTKGKGEWMNVRIEVKARIPKGVGSWPAIWMLGSITPLKWPDDGEIDIMEHVGYNQGQVHASVHTKSYNHVMNTQKTAIIQVADCSEEFHVYTLDWSKDTIKVLVDDKEYFRFANEHKTKNEWPFDAPAYLLLNVAVGGNWGGQRGVDPKAFPLKMEIDYVRVYQNPY